MKDNLLIIGTGDYAEAGFFLLKKSGYYNIVGFSEEKLFRKRETFCGLPIYDLEGLEELFNPADCKLLVAIGPNRVNTVRERIFNMLDDKGYQFITYIHESAYVWDKTAIGKNCFVFPNAVIEPFAKVGDNCVLWSGCILAHHVIVEDHCFLAPGVNISGRTVIKKNCFLGINSTIRDNITVAENCIVGAGSVIKKSTESNGVYSAIPTLKYSDKSLDTKV